MLSRYGYRFVEKGEGWRGYYGNVSQNNHNIYKNAMNISSVGSIFNENLLFSGGGGRIWVAASRLEEGLSYSLLYEAEEVYPANYADNRAAYSLW